MHATIILLTVLTVLLIGWQLIGAKGTALHKLRGVSIACTSVGLAGLVVTLSIQQGIALSNLLLIHITIGTAFFAALFAAIGTGFLQKRRKPYTRWHRRFGYTTAVLLVCSLASAVIARTFQP